MKLISMTDFILQKKVKDRLPLSITEVIKKVQK